MKKIVSVVLSLVLAFACVGALAETEISAAGIGVVSVLPNVATLNVGVSETNLDIAAAMATVNEKLDAIRASALALGVKESDIVLNNINIYSQYNYEMVPEQLVGFNVSHALDIKTRDLDSLGQLIDAAVKAGANQMNGVTFTFDDDGSAYAQALTGAVENAKEHAQTMAKAAGLSITGIEDMVEGNSNGYWGDVTYAAKNMEMGGMGDAATQIDYSTMTLTANVTVRFNAE